MTFDGTCWSEPVVVRFGGLVLREWLLADIPALVSMFDTSEMDRWTPLAHPFGPDVAADYVRTAHEGKASGSLQLAISTDGVNPIGEVLMFPTAAPEVCEFAYAVGAAHRGQAFASRAVLALLPLARERGYRTAVLTIAEDNFASQSVARAAGFQPVPGQLRRRERKGYVLHMGTWSRHI